MGQVEKLGGIKNETPWGRKKENAINIFWTYCSINLFTSLILTSEPIDDNFLYNKSQSDSASFNSDIIESYFDFILPSGSLIETIVFDSVIISFDCSIVVFNLSSFEVKAANVERNTDSSPTFLILLLRFVI